MNGLHGYPCAILAFPPPSLHNNYHQQPSTSLFSLLKAFFRNISLMCIVTPNVKLYSLITIVLNIYNNSQFHPDHCYFNVACFHNIFIYKYSLNVYGATPTIIHVSVFITRGNSYIKSCIHFCIAFTLPLYLNLFTTTGLV